ncbi:MAG: type II toxin-antitoxin system HipA family toxin [Verrucomicrobiia bacterium]
MSTDSLEVRLRFAPDREHKVGTLAMSGRDVVFQYAESFLGLNLALSPVHLPVRPGVQAFDGQGRMEVFGVFEDAMPDSWGRRLVDRHFQKTRGRPPEMLERLAYVGERAMGALTFHPPQDTTPLPSRELDLVGLGGQAWDFDADQIENALPDLRRLGGTSGGARPKVLVGLPENRQSPKQKILPGDGDLPPGYAHWIVKFNARADGPDAGPLEFAYAEIAGAAGVVLPEHRLIETKIGRFFAVRRFDRPSPGQRLHLHSAAGLLHADFRTPGDEYDLLFRLTESLTRDDAQKRELFRRACLNVLACNRDDHLKNFAFLMGTDGVWRLAPLYDFTFHDGPNGWQTLSVAGEGKNPRRAHLLNLADQVDLRPRDAAEILDQVRGAVAGFGKLATQLRLSKATKERVCSRLKEIDS